MYLTMEEARSLLKDCLSAAQANDHERAHGIEDRLHARALKTIADGQSANPQHLADIAARTAGIDFQRWCG